MFYWVKKALPSVNDCTHHNHVLHPKSVNLLEVFRESVRIYETGTIRESVKPEICVWIVRSTSSTERVHTGLALLHKSGEGRPSPYT